MQHIGTVTPALAPPAPFPDADPLDLAGMDAVDELRREAQARGWSVLHVVTVLVASGHARALLLEAIGAEGPWCTAERYLGPSGLGWLDRLVVLGLPGAAAAERLGDTLAERLAESIAAGQALVAPTLSTHA
jgi:hypothetical protein